MYDNNPKSQRMIREKIGENCLQLLAIEGGHFFQRKGIGIIAEEILKKFPEADLYISLNDHDFGSYYGLEISDSSFKKDPGIEYNSLIIANELGYDNV